MTTQNPQGPLYQPPPGYPPPYPPSQPQARNGFGITALVLGIVGVVIGTIPILGIPALAVGAVGIVFGGLALGRVRKRVATNKKMSWWGLSLSAVAVVLGIVGVVIVSNAFNDVQHNLNDIQHSLNNTPSVETTITPTP